MEKETILKEIFNLIPPESVKFIIHYGNLSGQDIDIFVVLKNSSGYKHIGSNLFDIACVGENSLGKALKYFDPIITEPILTGQIIYGESIKNLQREMGLLRANRRTVAYLVKCAALCYSWAKQHYLENNPQGAIVTLSFAVSYGYFAEYYNNNQKVITLAKLIEVFPNSLLTEIRSLVTIRIKVELTELDELFEKTRKILQESEKLL